MQRCSRPLLLALISNSRALFKFLCGGGGSDGPQPGHIAAGEPDVRDRDESRDGGKGEQEVVDEDINRPAGNTYKNTKGALLRVQYRHNCDRSN